MAATESLDKYAPLKSVLSATPEQLRYTQLQAALSGERFRVDNQVINLSDIILDDSLIADPDHVAEILPDIRDNDQHSPLLVSASTNISPTTGNPQLKITLIDGIHRFKVLEILKRSTAKANILYGITEEEVYDERILAASRGSITIARMLNWMEKSYQNSEWARFGLSLGQIFGLASNNSSQTRLTTMTAEQLKNLKLYAATKAERWGRDVEYMHGLFNNVEHANPALIAQLRDSKGGSEKVLTVQRLGAIANAYLDKDNYTIQVVIAAFSLENDLTTNETKALVSILKEKGLIHSASLPENIIDILRSITSTEDLKERFRLMQPIRKRRDSPAALLARIDALEKARIDYQKRVHELEAQHAEDQRIITELSSGKIGDESEILQKHFNPDFLAYVETLENENEKNKDRVRELESALQETLAQQNARPASERRVSISPLQTALSESQAYLGTYAQANKALRERVASLEKITQELRGSSTSKTVQKLQQELTAARQTQWWFDAPYLTFLQQTCLSVCFNGIQTIIAVARKANVAPEDIVAEAINGIQARLNQERARFTQAAQ